MSKGNFLMNTVSGKLGSMVLFRRKGEQVERTYLKTFKNANTRAQVTQRSQLANLVAFYRGAKRLLNHSFLARPERQSSYNAFVSANLNKISVFLPKTVADKQGCVVAPYQISKGSLAPIVISGIGDNAVTNIAVGDLAIDNTTTIAALTQALIANNQSIVEGMQLSYISCVQSQNVQLGVPTMEVGYYEITLDLTDETLVLDYMPEQAMNVVGGFIGHGTHVANGGFAWILSQRTADGLECSSQALIMNDMTTLAEYQGTVAETRAQDSYNAVDEAFLDPSISSGSDTSTQPIASSVSVGGKALVSGSGTAVSLSSGNNAVVVGGANLSNIETANLIINGTTYEGSDVVATDTGVNFKITLASSVSATAISLVLNGSTLYTWTSAASSGGSGDDQQQDPMG